MRALPFTSATASSLISSQSRSSLLTNAAHPCQWSFDEKKASNIIHQIKNQSDPQDPHARRRNNVYLARRCSGSHQILKIYSSSVNPAPSHL
ncbi:hypothetical protein PM082_000471 [Marasmius tenuissimus]|nr:hypothetical protein PM082_000471 [Marasmius tenuissimus]